jgi:hypothetical protein
MESDRSTEQSAGTVAARLRPVWRTTLELKAGMVLAKPVSAASGGYATMSLSAGGSITEETIAQMMVKGIECVAVFNTEPPSEAAYARATEQYTARLQQIFGPAPTPNCQALLDVLLLRGPVPC